MSKTSLSIIKSEEQYEEYMNEIMQLLESGLTPGTEQFDRFELLNLLVQKYEEQNYHVAKPDPIEAIKFRMDQQGLSQVDMVQYIGSASKVSEVLNRKRPLSLSMIKKIHNGLGIPLDILIQNNTDDENHLHVFDGWESIGLINRKSMTLSVGSTVFLSAPLLGANTHLRHIGDQKLDVITDQLDVRKEQWLQDVKELQMISSHSIKTLFDKKSPNLYIDNEDFREMVH